MHRPAFDQGMPLQEPVRTICLRAFSLQKSKWVSRKTRAVGRSTLRTMPCIACALKLNGESGRNGQTGRGKYGDTVPEAGGRSPYDVSSLAVVKGNLGASTRTGRAGCGGSEVRHEFRHSEEACISYHGVKLFLDWMILPVRLAQEVFIQLFKLLCLLHQTRQLPYSVSKFSSIINVIRKRGTGMTWAHAAKSGYTNILDV